MALARYPLIVKDSTYVALLQYGSQRGKTLGKLINEILNNFVAQIGVAGFEPANPVCIVCGERAVHVGFGHGQQKLYVCAHHKSKLDSLKGHKEIEMKADEK